MEKGRGLSETFMHDLSLNHLNPILEKVKKDDSLTLFIRDNAINIYYRGGSILGLKLNSNGDYIFNFDEKYIKNEAINLPVKLNNSEEVNNWVIKLPFIKQAMDEYFSIHSKSEREFQQVVARENNNSIISNETDYFITDIEYTQSGSKDGRFDLIGIKWDSSSNLRKSPNNCKLVIIEMKYGDSSLGGSAGVEKHIIDIENFCSSEANLNQLKQSTLKSFSQLRSLGLIKFGKGGNNNEITQLSSDKPEYILLIANSKPSNKKLVDILSKTNIMEHVDLKIATSSYMGYGLYSEKMLSIKDFVK